MNKYGMRSSKPMQKSLFENWMKAWILWWVKMEPVCLAGNVNESV